MTWKTKYWKPLKLKREKTRKIERGERAREKERERERGREIRKKERKKRVTKPKSKSTNDNKHWKTVQKKTTIKWTDRTLRQMVKSKLYRQNHTKFTTSILG